VSGELEAHDLSHLANDVSLVATELVTNALRHAGTPAQVSLTRIGQSLLLTVTDGSDRAPRPRQAAATDTGGRGLTIVEALTQQWGTAPSSSTTGKAVWASFSTQPAIPRQRART
jgi:two-component sensor histidine kinase